MGTPWRPEREIGSVQARAAVATSGYDGPLDSVEVQTVPGQPVQVPTFTVTVP